MAECSGHSKETNAHDQRQKQCNEIKQGTSYISFICFLMITFLYATFIRIDEYIAHHSFLWDRHDSFCFQVPLSYQKHTNLARIPSNKKRLRDPFIHLLNVFIQKKVLRIIYYIVKISLTGKATWPTMIYIIIYLLVYQPCYLLRTNAYFSEVKLALFL